MKLYKVGILTLSDSSYAGIRVDESGPLAASLLPENEYKIVKKEVLPDEAEVIKKTLIDWCATCDLILTTGGTGLAVRDVTPEATLAVADRIVPGISEALRAYSLSITKTAMLSRGEAVVRDKTLIINLPGSKKAVLETVTYLLPILRHALDLVTDFFTSHD